MEQVWNDFKKAVQEAERKGTVLVRTQRNETELDRAVIRYKEEQEKAARLARFFA